MRPVLAFDVYGTLVDPAAMARSPHLPADNAAAFAARWREKQLEYAFRRALMRRYVSFSECTKAALDYVCAEKQAALSAASRAALLSEYETLPAFSDAAACLQHLSAFRLFAFSNGEETAVQKVLAHNRLDGFFESIISVGEVRTFKPAPEVYAHFLRRAAAKKENTWLVSANPFDIAGASAAGWKTAWLRRGGATPDPWAEFAPEAVAKSLAELPEILP